MMSVLRVIKHNWGLFRWFGLGFCSLNDGGGELTFSTLDVAFTVILNAIYIASSWWFIVRTFFTYSEESQTDGPAIQGGTTLLIVAYLSFFTEQVAYNLLFLLSLKKQSNFLQICNKLHEFDKLFGKHFKTPQDSDFQELRVFYWFNMSTTLIFVGLYIVYILLIHRTFSWLAFAELPALIRPVVNDSVNLIFVSIVLLINNRLHRLERQLQRPGDNFGRLFPVFLLQLSECIEAAGREFSTMFLIQSVRILITVDNQFYQLMVLLNTGLISEYYVLLIFLVALISFSTGVYIFVHFTCNRTSVAYQRLVNRYTNLHRNRNSETQSSGGGRERQMFLQPTPTSVRDELQPPRDEANFTTCPGFTLLPKRLPTIPTPTLRSTEETGKEIDRESKICLHFLHQRNQRQGHGFGFTAFGVIDIDLMSSFEVSEFSHTDRQTKAWERERRKVFGGF